MLDEEIIRQPESATVIIRFHDRTCVRRLDSLLDSDNISTNISAAGVVILLIAREERRFQRGQ